MLPTKGYFQDIECPFYNTTCGRPYCHFRHKRKPNENVEENVQDSSKTVVPTYKPTPKSELANIHNNKSHIPISYVPDFKRERTVRTIRIDKPTYKPTPLSILSSATTSDSTLTENHEHKETIKGIKENIASNVYDPLKSEINFEELSNEFELIDDIINNSKEEPPSSINDNLTKLENDIEKEQNRLNLLQSEINNDDVSDCDEQIDSKDFIKPKFSSDEGDDTATKCKGSDLFLIKPEDIKKEKPDTISSSNDKNSSTSNVTKDEKNDKVSKSLYKDRQKSSDKNKDRSSSKEKSSKEKSSTEKSSKEKSSKEKSSKEKSSKERDLKKSETSSKSHKSSEREKHRKEEKKNSSKERENSKDKHTSKNKSKARSKSPKDKKNYKKRSKNKSESTTYSSSNDSSPDRSKKQKKNDNSKTKKHISREKSNSRSKEKDKKPKESRSKSRSTSREKSSMSKQKSKKRSRSRSRNRGKDDKKQTKNKEAKEKTNKSHDKNKDKERESSNKAKSRDSTLKKSTDDKKDKKKKLTSESNYSLSENENDHDIFHQESFMETEDLIPSDVDLDLDDEDETMRECYKIFNEYVPEPIKKQPKSEELGKPDLFEDDLYHCKKRRAHAGAEIMTNYSKLHPIAPPKPSLLPGQTLANRYRIAKMAQASNEQENIMNEIKSITSQSAVKRPATSLLEAARQHKMKRLQQQRSAERNKPTVNIVDDILNGKHKPSQSQVKALPKKIAAVPNVALMEKAKQRISLVKQQRMESVKTVAHTQKSGRKAHVPEYSLSDIPDVLQADKSKLPVNVRTRYLTMLADECAKLYALKNDAYNRALNEEFTCYEKCKVLATYRNSAMLAVSRLRKELQERENKGLGPLLSGESPSNKKETDFEGTTFYNHMKRWILTEEELDIHGYPKESGERGKAIINKKTEVDYSIVDENQRKCCRCSKIYQVDDDGWPLFEDECMYHPMKKRTIRGEQTFLCCKSNDDTGCATSETHVFDGLQKHLLEGYQTTLPPESDDDARSIQVYALDCEMCYTTRGLELTRVTVVDTECRTVYESFVKPFNPIIDYNTRFSGITKDQMDRTSTSILQVQANILHLCNSETILVGHSLESDMKALKIVHRTVVDTAVLFPHKMGLPYKRALRALASEHLKKIIQNDVAGHDSAEDAVACMDLIKWKLKEELKTKTK